MADSVLAFGISRFGFVLAFRRLVASRFDSRRLAFRRLWRLWRFASLAFRVLGDFGVSRPWRLWRFASLAFHNFGNFGVSRFWRLGGRSLQ